MVYISTCPFNSVHSSSIKNEEIGESQSIIFVERHKDWHTSSVGKSHIEEIVWNQIGGVIKMGIKGRNSIVDTYTLVSGKSQSSKIRIAVILEMSMKFQRVAHTA